MEKQDPGELSGGVEVGPVDSRAAITRVENEGLERRVHRSQESEIGWAIGVLVFWVDSGSFRSLSLVLLAGHFWNSGE